MTPLTKPVTRRTELDPKLGGKERGQVSVTLYPDGTIGFRKLKRREEVKLTLSGVYSLALKAQAAADRAAKKKLKKVGK